MMNNILLLLAACFLSTSTFAGQINLGVVNFFPNGACSGTPDSIPLVQANQCHGVSGVLGMNWNCTSQAIDVFLTSTCTGKALVSLPFGCTSGLGFGCKTFDDNQVVKMTIGNSACSNPLNLTLPDVSLSFFQLINQCLQLPAVSTLANFPVPKGFYEVTVNTSDIIFRTWSSSNTCSGPPTDEVVGQLNRCVDGVSLSSVGVGRLLSSTGAVVFEPSQSGAVVQGSVANTSAPTSSPTRHSAGIRPTGLAFSMIILALPFVMMI